MSNNGRVQGDLHVGRDIYAQRIDIEKGITVNDSSQIAINSATNTALTINNINTGDVLRLQGGQLNGQPIVVDQFGDLFQGLIESPDTRRGVFLTNDRNSSPVVLLSNRFNGADSASLTFRKSRIGSAANNNDSLGLIVFEGVTSTSSVSTAAAIQAQQDGSAGISDVPSRLTFSTTGSSGSVTERMRINNAGLITGTGTSLGAWTAYTPTLGGTGWALGNGTATGKYVQIGKIIHFFILITFGSTSTFGASNRPTLTLPVARVSGTPFTTYYGEMRDVSLSSSYAVAMRHGTNTTTGDLYYLGANGVFTDVVAAAPFTFADTDTIRISGTYEAA
jgi:hypothetical protein